MNESDFYHKEGKLQVHGNPAEGALLKMAKERWEVVKPRSQWRRQVDQGTPLTKRVKVLASAQKMRGSAIPKPGGRWMIFEKAAIQPSFPVLRRDTRTSLGMNEFVTSTMTETIISKCAKRSKRSISLAYKTVGEGFATNYLGKTDLNADSNPAFKKKKKKVGLTLLGIVISEDPLQPEVAPPIKNCYRADIDVRMGTATTRRPRSRWRSAPATWTHSGMATQGQRRK
jgi:magnesium-transporting ATPase (P-type)